MANISEQQNKSEDKLLYLMPLVQMAWAHGAIAAREKHLIFESAREDGVDERDSLNDKLNDYLINQPSRKFFEECLDKISDELRAMTVREREELKTKIIKRCRRVAESAGGNSAMDISAFMSAEEQSALTEIAEHLNFNLTNETRISA